MRQNNVNVRRYTVPDSDKVKGAITLREVETSCSSSFRKSMTYGQRDARPTVTFPSLEQLRRMGGTNSYCLVTEALCVNNLPKVIT